MSKLRNLNVVVAFLGLSAFTVLPAFPQGNGNAGCKNGEFIGSYTHLDTFSDIWGDGSNVEHQLIEQLSLHSDGTVTEEFTGDQDTTLSFGLRYPKGAEMSVQFWLFVIAILLFAIFWELCKINSHLKRTLRIPPRMSEGGIADDTVIAKTVEV